MTNNQFTLVIGKHIFSGDRELTTSYVLDLNNQINIDSFSLNGVKALAKTSLMNSLRSNATFIVNDEDHTDSLNPLELVYHDQVEIFSPDSNEFLELNAVVKISDDQLAQQFVTPQPIKLNTNQINQIKNLESSFIQAVQQANFTDHVVLPRELDFMDFECVDENLYLFDTVAYVGKIAEINVSGLDLKVLYNQTSRLTCSCTANEMNSVVLDDEFYSENSDKRNWIVLAKTKPYCELADWIHYEVNRNVYFGIDLYTQNHINAVLSEVADSLDFPKNDAINSILESMKDTIFVKSEEDLQNSIDTSDI